MPENCEIGEGRGGGGVRHRRPEWPRDAETITKGSDAGQATAGGEERTGGCFFGAAS